MSGLSPSALLAPREIRDLVYRSCRVAGCDAGVADRFAANILHAEIHRGGGLQTFLSVLAEGPEAVGALAAAADVIEQAEVEAREAGASTASFTEPTPLAALSRTLWDAALRGVIAPPVLADAGGGEAVTTVELRRGPLAEDVKVNVEKRQAEAFRQGIFVSQSVLAQVERQAGEFLVSEATLDALAE